MLINNIGTTKMIVQNNNQHFVNETQWDAKYDGTLANIKIDSNINGEQKHYSIKLDNHDLADMLSIEPIDRPIDERLVTDFEDSQSYQPYYIELQPPKLKPRRPTMTKSKSKSLKKLIAHYLSPKNRKKSEKHKKKKSITRKRKRKIHSILEEIL